MIHDIEGVLVSRLIERGLRASTRHPEDTSTPWILVTLLDASDITGSHSSTDHLIDYLVQLDCYAGSGGSPEAVTLVINVRRILYELEGQTYNNAVFSRVKITSQPRVPDRSFQPSRERYVMTISLRAR